MKVRPPKCSHEPEKRPQCSPCTKYRPIAPKKAKHEEIAKLKKMISKNVNRKLEEEIRGAATDGQKVKLSKKKNQNPSVDPNKMPPKST
ncbi:hypothetical protein GE061_005044 [Apolygus lucorum]|uniref:Uncharacterized protein n=1 Tax=Apolygus lucorum TaxID=248454 RepID=A0A8S9WWW4_APOLU|nr:hypothetical protein GE061_005044 [Apolygus lucorum]